MTYTKEELGEFTKKELIDILREEGDTHVGKKRITKCNKDVLVDFIFSTYCVETKPINEDSIEIIAEEEPVVVEEIVEETPVDVDALLNKAKAKGKEKKQSTRQRNPGATWIPRIQSLLVREDLKTNDETYVIPMSELKAILQLPDVNGKPAGAYRYSCDWKVKSGMPAGYALARMGYKATLSLAKGKENLKISKEFY